MAIKHTHNITCKKIPGYCGYPIHCVAFDGTCRDRDPRVIHASKARALLTGVESEVHDLVKQALQIELRKIDDDLAAKD